MRAMLAVALLVFLTNSQAQDFNTGMAAFEKQDYSAALAILGDAAIAGDPDAQFVLGRMYARGLGVLQDFVQAHRWYNVAAANGQRMAPLARDAISEEMTAEQIALAQQMAQKSMAESANNQADTNQAATNQAGTPRIRPADTASNTVAATPSTTTASTTTASTAAPVRLVPRAADVATKPAVVSATPRAADSSTNNDSNTSNTAAVAAPAISASSGVTDSSQIQVSESTIARIQLGLRRLGYKSVGAPTGKVNDNTRKAIQDYQKKSRLPVDGRPTPALLVHIDANLRGEQPQGIGGDSDQDSSESGVQWKRLL